MSRKFIVVALVAASSFVCLSADSEAGHLRRGRHMGYRHHATVPTSSCNTGCGSYSTSPTMANYGNVGASQMSYEQGQTAVYGGASSPMASPSTAGCGCGSAGQLGYTNRQ